MLSFIFFLIGLILGGTIGIVLMCLFQINRINKRNWKEGGYEKDD